MKFLQRLAAHPISTLMVYAALLLFGAISASRIKVELLPTLHIPIAHVVAEYENIPAEEMEKLIAVPLENTLSSVKGVTRIRSASKQGICGVSLHFRWDTNIDRAAVEVRERIDAVYPFLPHGASRPLVFTEDAGYKPLAVLAALPKERSDPGRFGRIVSKELKTRVLQLASIAEVRVVGAAEPEIQVEADMQRLNNAGLNLSDLARIIASSVFTIPLGTITEGSREFLVEASTGIRTTDQVGSIPFGGRGLKISDFARVRMGEKERTSFFAVNGQSGIGLYLYKTGTSGTLNAAEELRRSLPRLQEAFAGTMDLLLLEEGAAPIRESLAGLFKSILLGIVAATLILFPLFRSVRLPLNAVASIPACMAVVAIVMDAASISANLISLAGAAIGVGMIFDNSIVVLEHLDRSSAKSPRQIAQATLEMGSSTFGSTITTILVFLPVLFIPGLLGALFTELAVTISVLLAASYAVSLTLTPALYALTVRHSRTRHPSGGAAASTSRSQLEPRFLTALARVYRNLLFRGMRRPVPFILLSLMGIAAVLLLADLVPREIIPLADRGSYQAEILFPGGVPIRQVQESVGILQQRLVAAAPLEMVYAAGGYDRGSLRERAEPQARIRSVRMGLRARRSRGGVPKGLIARLDDLLRSAGGVSTSVEISRDLIQELLEGSSAVTVRFSGEKREPLLTAAQRLQQELRREGLSPEVDIDTRLDLPEVRLSLEPDRLLAGGMEASQVLQEIQTAVRGTLSASLRIEDEQTDIRVRGLPEQVVSAEQLGRLRISGSQGGVTVDDLGDFHPERAYEQLLRWNRKPAVTVWFQPSPEARRNLESRLARVGEAGGVVLSESALRESLGEVLLTMAVALTLMYLLLGAQFESFSLPLLLLGSLPLSIAGGLLALALSGKSLNLGSFLGILILMGTAINITILLADSYHGASQAGAVVRGSIGRLKPVLATVGTTVAALVPLAISGRPESALQSATAVAVLGGLAFGTLLTMPVFPVLYWLARRKRS